MNERREDRGFTLIEVLLVLVIVSILTLIMVYTASGARSIATANQTLNVAQQNARYTINLMERDIRQAGGGLYTNTYFTNNGNIAGEQIGADPAFFEYEVIPKSLNGFTVPPIEVINGTDDDPASFFMQFALSDGGGGVGDPPVVASSAYREPDTDMLTVFYSTGVGFEGKIDTYDGEGQEMFGVEDTVVGDRLMRIWDQIGGGPLLIFVASDDGDYGTFKVVTNVRQTGPTYDIDVNPSHPVNSPTNMKKLLESLDGHAPSDVEDDLMMQLSIASYFVYRHPTIASARGWLVRIDSGAMTAGAVDLTDPNNVRPYVLAENVVDFQVALGIDNDDSGMIDPGEWHNSEDMEDYTKVASGDGTTSTEFEDLVNDLRAVRFSIVTYTDQLSEDDAIGFVDRNSSNFYSVFPTVNDVARQIGISPTLEDHTWDHGVLADRLWYRRAVQQSRTSLIRNLDLENAFARAQ